MRYDEEFRFKAVMYVKEGHSIKETTEKFKICRESIWRWVKQYKKSKNLKDKRIPNKKIDGIKLREYIINHPKASQKDIAKHFGSGKPSVSLAIKKHRIPYSKKLARIDVNEVIEYIKANRSLKLTEVSKHFGVYPNYVSFLLRKKGIRCQQDFKPEKAATEEDGIIYTYKRTPKSDNAQKPS